MTRVHNIAEIMRRTGLSREALGRLRKARIIEPADASPLGRPLFHSGAYARIERAEQLRELGMSLGEIRRLIERDRNEMPCSSGAPTSVRAAPSGTNG